MHDDVALVFAQKVVGNLDVALVGGNENPLVPVAVLGEGVVSLGALAHVSQGHVRVQSFVLRLVGLVQEVARVQH